MHTSNLGDNALMGLGEYEVDDETAGVLLEALGEVYGAMGYTAMPSSMIPADDNEVMAGITGVTDFGEFGAEPDDDLDDDIEMEGFGEFGDLGARMPRFRAKWLKKRYVPASRNWRRRFNQAGTNVKERCPRGRKVEFATETRAGKRRYRWVCRERKGGSPTQIWNRKKRRWDARKLFCPATRGYGMKARITCSTDRPKGRLKRVAKGIEKGAKKAVKIALTPLTLIGKFALQIVMKIAMPLAKAICKFPEPLFVSVAAAQMPGTHPNYIRGVRKGFCQAIRIRNYSQIRKLLPPILKISIKVAGATAVPGLGPALTIAKSVPGLSKVLSFAGPGGGMGEADPIVLLDSMSQAQMAEGIAGMSDAELAAGLGVWETKDTAKVALVGGLLALAGYGIYAATRER